MTHQYVFDIPFDSDWYSQPDLMESYKSALLTCAERDGIVLVRGDSVRSSQNDYRDEGVLLWNGKELVELDEWPDEYGTNPKEFSMPEFLPDDLQRAHNSYMWLNTADTRVTWFNECGDLINHHGQLLNGRTLFYPPAWPTIYGWEASFEINSVRYHIHQFQLKQIYESDRIRNVMDPWAEKNPLVDLIETGEMILLDLGNEDEIQGLNIKEEERPFHFVLFNGEPPKEKE